MNDEEIISLLVFSAKDGTYKDILQLIISEKGSIGLGEKIIESICLIEEEYKIDTSNKSDFLLYKSKFNSVLEYKEYARNLKITNIIKK